MHLNNIFYYSYFYRYAEARKQIKNLLDIDISATDTLLNQYIAENDNYIQNVTADFAKDDNKQLHHAREHLDVFQNTGQPHQKDATARALENGS